MRTSADYSSPHLLINHFPNILLSAKSYHLCRASLGASCLPTKKNRGEAQSVGGLQGVGCDRQGQLQASAVAHDAQVNELARLQVAHAILEVEKVGDARAVNADDHVVALADLHVVQRRNDHDG